MQILVLLVGCTRLNFLVIILILSCVSVESHGQILRFARANLCQIGLRGDMNYLSVTWSWLLASDKVTKTTFETLVDQRSVILKSGQEHLINAKLLLSVRRVE